MGTPMAFTSGTTNGFSVGATKRATTAVNPGTSLVTGTNWWNGVDVNTSQYLIYSDTFSQGQATITTARPTAWTTPNLSDSALLALINTLPDRVGQVGFTNINVAIEWLQNSEKYFLIKKSYENIVTDGLVLNLDAGWANSYPGTGTVWTDLTGSGNNVSLVNGPTLSSVGGGSILMDGADDWAGGSGQCPQVLFNNSQSHSFSLWIKKNGSNSGNYAYIYDKYGTTRIPGLLFLLNSNTLAVEWWAGYWNLLNTGLDVETGNWNFVVVTINAPGAGQTKTVNVYLYKSTGLVTVTLTSSADWNASSNGEFAIGKSISNGTYFNGNIANVVTYNRVISPAEVQQNYEAQRSRFGYWGQSLFSGTTQYYDFSKGQSYPGSGTAMTDVSGNGYNGTISGGNFTTIDGVKCWNCTTNGVILTDSDFTFGNDYTILTWARVMPDSAVSTWRTLFRTITHDHPLIVADGSDLIGYYDNDDGGSFVSYGLTVGGLGIADRWVLYSMVGSGGSSQKLYINEGTTNATVNYSATGENQDALGNESGGSQPFGYVSSCVVYNNQAFTQSQITQYFNATKQYYGYAPNNTITNGLVLSLDAGNPFSYPTTGTTWYDLSNYGRNTTLYNGSSYSSSFGGTINFDGSDDYASPGSLGGGFSTFTVEIWFKSDSVVNYRNPIDCNYLIENGSYSNLGPRLEQDSNGKLTWVVGSGNDVYSFVTLLSSGMSSTPYHYAAITKTTSSNFDGYYNGNYTSNLNLSNWPGSMLNLNLGRGFSTSGERYFIGNIPVVRIYNRALSAGEILQNYNAQKSRFGL